MGSDKLIPNIIGYHTNDKNRCKKFIYQSEPIFCEDTDWLGFGMYFWDNLYNAHWWMDEKRKKALRKDPTAKPIFWIFQATLIIDKLLDLTDQEWINKFQELWQEYCRITHTRETQPLGRKLDLLFSHSKLELDKKFDIIKVSGGYEYIDIPLFFMGSKADSKSKVIYNVKNINIISNCKQLEESA